MATTSTYDVEAAVAEHRPADEAAFRHGYRDGHYSLDDWTENPNANPACFASYRAGRAAAEGGDA